MARPGSAPIRLSEESQLSCGNRKEAGAWIHSIYNFALQITLLFIQSLANIMEAKNSSNLHRYRVHRKPFTFFSRSLPYRALCSSEHAEGMMSKWGFINHTRPIYNICTFWPAKELH